VKIHSTDREISGPSAQHAQVNSSSETKMMSHASAWGGMKKLQIPG